AGAAGAVPRRAAAAGLGGEPADLQVRDRDAADRDRDQPEHAAEPEPPVGVVAAPPTRECERREDAPDQAADVAAPRDPREREAEDQVDRDQRHRLTREPAGRLVLDDQQRAEDSEDRPRRADGGGERRLQQSAGGAGEAGGEVQAEEARAS